MASLAARCAHAASAAGTAPKKVEIGLQLYTVLADATADPAGTLARVRALGVRQVEALYGAQTTPAFAAHVADAGLQVRSVHISPFGFMPGVPSLATDAPAVFARSAELRAEWVVCSSPLVPEALRADMMLPGNAVFEKMTEMDWRAHAEFLNRMGAEARRAGLRLGYHCHPQDFLRVGGVPAFHRLAEWTDPALVDFEVDCGWAAAAGFDPSAEIRRLGPRCRMLHLKDWVLGTGGEHGRRLVPLGQGQVPIAPILQAAAETGVAVAFVEQDPPSQTQRMLPEVERTFAYLRSLNALPG